MKLKQNYKPLLNRELDRLGCESKKNRKRYRHKNGSSKWSQPSPKNNKIRKYNKYLTMISGGKQPTYKRTQKWQKVIFTWTETYSKPITKFFDEWLKMIAGSDIVVPPAGSPDAASVAASMGIESPKEIRIPVKNNYRRRMYNFGRIGKLCVSCPR